MESSSCGWSDIKVSPDRFDFEVPEGWQFVPPGQYLKLERDGTGMSPRFEVSADQEWVIITTKSGTVPSLFISIGARSIGKPAGIYLANLTITASPDSVTVSPSRILVTLTVTPKDEPAPPPSGPPGPPEPPPSGPSGPPEPPPSGPSGPPEPPPSGPSGPPEEESWFRRFLGWLIDLLRRIR